MRTSVLAVAALVVASCGGGSVGFVTQKNDAGAPVPLQVDVVAPATVNTQVQLLAKGAEVEPYAITVTSEDPTRVTAVASPTTADVKDGVPFDINLEITVAPNAAPGLVSVDVTAKATQMAGTSVLVNINPT